MYAKDGQIVVLISHFVASGAAATGLTVTGKVWELTGAGAKSPNDTTGTTLTVAEIGGGAYKAVYEMVADGVPLAVFSTTGTADVKSVPASAIHLGTLDTIVTDVAATHVHAAAADTQTVAAAIGAAVWNYLTASMTTASSIGKKLADWVVGTITANQNVNVAQWLGATAPTMGTPATSIMADIAAVKGDTGNLVTRLTATRAGYLDQLEHIHDDTNSTYNIVSSPTAGVAHIDAEVDAIKAKTDLIPAVPAAVGSAMTLTTGERTAIANEVEAQIIDETDSEKVLTAITNKIAAVNPSLSGLTLAAIGTAAAGAVLVTPANKLATDASGHVTVENMVAAAPAASTIAAAILATPANKLATDADGHVTAENMVAAAPSIDDLPTNAELAAAIADLATVEAAPDLTGLATAENVSDARTAIIEAMPAEAPSIADLPTRLELASAVADTADAVWGVIPDTQVEGSTGWLIDNASAKASGTWGDVNNIIDGVLPVGHVTLVDTTIDLTNGGIGDVSLLAEVTHENEDDAGEVIGALVDPETLEPYASCRIEAFLGEAFTRACMTDGDGGWSILLPKGATYTLQPVVSGKQIEAKVVTV